MIHNGLGEIVTSTFEIDIFRSGFEQLCQAVDQAIKQTQAQVVLVGMNRPVTILRTWPAIYNNDLDP